MDMKTDRYLYVTPDGFANLVLSVAGGVLTEVSFVKDEAREGLPKAIACHDVPEYARAVNEARESGKGEDAISLAVKWLDIYFAGGRPDFLPPYELRNVTPFRQQVMDLLLAIPYGQTVTYGELAKRLAEANGRENVCSGGRSGRGLESHRHHDSLSPCAGSRGQADGLCRRYSK